MIRFDWRRYEPGELRRDGWPEPISSNLVNRYDGILREPSPWRELVAALFERRPDAQPAEFEWLDAFDRFLEDIPAVIIPPQARGHSPQTPCVFISHQRLDGDNGLRVACLAEHQGVDCWLDVLDPTLGYINTALVNDPRYSLLVAATIEIALLSSTHVIALQTIHSQSSKWVPYELGRAKARKIRSLQAANWLQQGQTIATCGDYVQLAVMTHKCERQFRRRQPMEPIAMSTLSAKKSSNATSAAPKKTGAKSNPAPLEKHRLRPGGCLSEPVDLEARY